MQRIFAIAAAGVLVAMLAVLGGLVFLRQGGDPFEPCRTTRIAGGSSQIGGPFTLLDSTGATVTDTDVVTEPSLIYFGYTFCPDVCPFDAARNAQTTDILAERGLSIAPIFISVDPERDTPEVMGDFASNIHPKMIGLTGSAEQIRHAAQAYKAYYKRGDDDPDYYLISHSNFSYLTLPGYGFVEVFRGAPNANSEGLDADQLADQLQCYLKVAQQI